MGTDSKPGGPDRPSSVDEAVAIDPVCGMPVDQAHAVTLEHDGRLVFFCSRGCRDEFLGVSPLRQEARAEELVRRILDTPALLGSAFQPIVSLESGRVAGYEALVRFAAVPLQTPDAWFDLAARAGLTPELEALAIRSALLAIDRSPPPGDTFVSINVSPLLLGDSRVAAALLAPSLPGSRLVLELTEHDRVADYDSLRAAVSPYRTAGIRIAVDDTGAGYASLRHITELQPDVIKLDARLITGLSGDRARQALVRAVATFADEIGAAVVAEGVEDLDDVELLVRARHILVQGYAVGRASAPWPVPSDRFLEHLAVQAPAGAF